jgi:pimeloyl-ACP methyl ester carboxylesterase
MNTWTGYLPITGTWAKNDRWAWSTSSDFAQMMNRAKCFPLCDEAGTVLGAWSSRLAGLWWQGIEEWQQEADRLAPLVERMPYRHRNLIAHSHGGQVALLIAARGVELRTLTTVGTPVRSDIPLERAKHFTGLWQHIYDERIDWMATARRLGGLGDGKISLERRFRIEGVRNYPVEGIGHSKVLRDPKHYPLWERYGWIEAIRKGPQ